VHGWLGVNNTKAVPPPPGAAVGSSAWWLWRVTPYPWRYMNEADKGDPRNEPPPLAAAVLNFAVLVALLWLLGRKPLREGLRKRAAAIMSEIDAARAIKRQARKRLKAYQSELDRLDETSEALRQKYAAEAEAETQGLLAEAAQTRDRMLADASFRVDQEAKTARDLVSREAMEQALTAAESLLRTRLTAADRDRLAEEYLSFVGAALRNAAAAAPSRGARA
jgi:F-type H+-transporting ATPase subunit b